MSEYIYAMAFFVGLVFLAVVVDILGGLLLRTGCGRRLYEWLFGPDDGYDD